ncbi:MAG: oxygen-independent coproporphyrinogen III oxidase [Clostridia bacterium]|nr:oxygen-independent coproporphyrinogen III oxidase [Clostridia bacterium]
MKSLYIHIPFCAQKCWYCDFNSYSGKEKLIDDYMIALKKEIQSYSLHSLKTIYFGGGTPSFVDAKYIEEMLQLCDFAETEVTLEVNPGTATKEKLEAYLKAGVNRLSIGLQATQNRILKEIGRIHTLEEFERTYKLAREVGFQNVNVDLMFGLPDQTLKDVKESVAYLLTLKPEHVSCYSLILHGETDKKMPSEEAEREMYHYIVNRLKEAGYIHYEISNFAKPGYESRHNLAYWNQEEYVGVGAGASSYVNGTRYTNVRNLEAYIGGAKPEIEEVQNAEDRLREYMILRLRLLEGVDIATANEKFGINVEEKFDKAIEKMKHYGLLEVTDGHMRLTEKGLDLANVVWEEFV